MIPVNGIQALALSLALVVILRLGPALLWSSSLQSSDALYYRGIARRIRNHGVRVVASAVRSTIGYPVIIAFSPGPLRWLLTRAPSVIADAGHLLLFAFLSWSFVSIDASAVAIGLVLLAVAPAWLYIGLGPRAFHATDRPLGEFLVAVALVSGWVAWTSGDWPFWIITILASSLVPLTSKFSLQALLVMGTTVSLISPITGLAILGGLFASVFLTRGFTWSLMRAQWGHLRWYQAAGRAGRSPVQGRNSLAKAKDLYQNEGVMGLLRYLLMWNSVVAATAYFLPHIVLFGWAFAAGWLPSWDFGTAWVMGALIAFMITSMPGGLFLGEAERYLIHAQIPIHFLFVQQLDGAPEWIIPAFFIYAIAWWVFSVSANYAALRMEGKDIWLAGTLTHLARMPKVRVMSWGKTRLMWALMARTDHDHFLLDSRIHREVTWDQVFTNYPYTSWRGFQQLECNCLVFEHQGKAELPNGFPARRFNIIHKNERYGIAVIHQEHA